jgi:hypothetical protein
MPKTPFYAALHRTWDPVHGQDIKPVKVDHQFEACRRFVPKAWDATKIGGDDYAVSSDRRARNTKWFFQFNSIQPAPKVAWPWLNRQQSFDLNSKENGYGNRENSFVLGDMGALQFCLKANGEVKVIFRCS